MTDILLSIQGLTKAYPGVVANDTVSFDIGVGEVHALLGENGAGKSTLVKMIYGLVKPDTGQMILRGQPYAPPEPRAARADGIAMVFQHFSLFDALNVSENIALGMEDPPPMRDLARRIRGAWPIGHLRLCGIAAGKRGEGERGARRAQNQTTARVRLLKLMRLLRHGSVSVWLCSKTELGGLGWLINLAGRNVDQVQKSRDDLQIIMMRAPFSTRLAGRRNARRRLV